MNKKINRSSSVFSFRKITALFILAVFLLNVLSACTQNSGVSSAKITEDEAKKIALADCGLQESEIRNKTIILDTENGISVYEFDFDSSTHEYEYDIDASTGKIISKSKEALDSPPEKRPESSAETNNTTPPLSEITSGTVTGEPDGNPQTVTLEQAKAIALSDAGVSENGVKFTKEKQDTENGTTVYDFEFYTEKNEYEYEIDLQGKIIKKEAKSRPLSPSEPVRNISEEKALEAALADAGLSRSQVTVVKTEYDRDDNKYEIEFYSGSAEYEYEIDAASGDILKREKENRSPVGADQTITSEEALAKALADAGLSRSQVTVVKTEYDRDDNKYEIEFYSGSAEYEYEIDAASGGILKRERENSSPVGSDKIITSEEALAKALADAGLSRSQVTVVKTEYDRDDNKYEIEFYSGSAEYEYEIDAASGSILKKETDNYGGGHHHSHHSHHSHHNCY